jgi:regulatory protein
MKITKIGKKDSANVVISFENDEALFLSVEVFMKSGLRKGDDIFVDRFLNLKRENQLYYIKQRAFRYLGRRLHSKSELRTKLLQKRYEIDLINEVLNQLEENKYLDDSEFAMVFSEEKIKSKKWSEQKLKAELIKRGVNSNITNKVLKKVITADDNYKNAFSVAERKFKSLSNRNLDNQSIKMKLNTFLKSRGFNYDVIKEVCEKLLNE